MQKNTKYLLCTILTLAVIAGVLYGFHSTVNASSWIGKDLYVSNNSGPEKYEKAGEPFLTVSVDEDTITVKRGTTDTVMLTLKYESGKNPNAKFTVAPKINEYFFPVSGVKSETMQERSAMLANGQIPNRVSSMKDLVTFSPQSVTLASGESKEIQMHIVIPSDLPDSMVGNTITLSPLFDVSNKQGIDTLGILTTSVTLKVQG